MWRPDNFNALWEETFHTVTEAYNRVDASWSFEQGSTSSQAMQSDIDQGMYDIEEQNKLEAGQYDWQTAVNEYVHQIWVIQFAGSSDVLTDAQKSVVAHMKTTSGFPMTVNRDYPHSLAAIIK
jgi:hypothetical protein